MASRAIWSPMADDKAAGAPVGVHGRRQAPPPSHEPAQAASTPAEPDSGPVRIDRGEPLPLGLHDCRDGLNIAVFSRHATAMTLLLYETAAGTQPSARFPLDARCHRTGDIWHASLTGDLRGKLYALQADGPRSRAGGDEFDPHQTLLDPYAAAVTDLSGGSRGRCVIADQRFDWADDAPLRHPWSETILYETHVRGLTIDPSSGVRRPGEYLGVVEKIPYLRELGITALELMPVQAFDPEAAEGLNPLSGERLRDYWGYNPVALFAPMPGYAGDVAPGGELVAFKTMVRELHRAGIEIILDVVFNHTAEGGRNGPTYSFRGLDDAIYYILTPDGEYVDYSGCGNTLNCNHPVVRSMVVDCLRHWVIHCHVDGFRFDLASVLGRDEQGNLLANPPLLEQIAEDPILRDVKLIAEAWDAGGAFQVGSFPGGRWAEWNCHFRDDVRRFWRGDPGMTGALATRLAGSSDLYQPGGESPLNSINFITSHDGFTLNDLVSYARKHNEANGEDNRDGLDENYSDNNGAEGPTDDPHIEAMRLHRIRNLLATLLLSRGVPMLLGGDEFRRSQAGNNNPWCQDNALSWYDWRLVEENGEVLRFVRGLIALRRRHPCLRNDAFYRAEELDWFGPQGHAPDWDGPTRAFGCRVRECAEPGMLCLLLNASDRPADFHLPDAPWRLEADTGQAPPGDICAPDDLPPLPDRQRYALAAGSLAVLSHL